MSGIQRNSNKLRVSHMQNQAEFEKVVTYVCMYTVLMVVLIIRFSVYSRFVCALPDNIFVVMHTIYTTLCKAYRFSAQLHTKIKSLLFLFVAQCHLYDRQRTRSCH